MQMIYLQMIYLRRVQVALPPSGALFRNLRGPCRAWGPLCCFSLTCCWQFPCNLLTHGKTGTIGCVERTIVVQDTTRPTSLAGRKETGQVASQPSSALFRNLCGLDTRDGHAGCARVVPGPRAGPSCTRHRSEDSELGHPSWS